MEQDFSTIQLADLAKELNGNLVIEYHTATIRLDKEQLAFLQANGFPTDMWSCITAGFAFSQKSEAELSSFLEEAEAAQSNVRIQFVADDGSALNVQSKESNPLLNQLIQCGDDPVSVCVDDAADGSKQ